jgi:asparagine synthase (glutamine-hydrolysing)
VIAFNGEIYNFRELRAGLAADGVKFLSDGDTEVVLELYRRHGPKCVKRLRGMFAFAVWSEDEQTCFLARDPLGIKPLYYYVDPNAALFAFASELRPLIRSALVPKKVSRAGLEGYFQSGSVPEPDTLIDGVQMLEAGSWMKWSGGRTTGERQYWQLNFAASENGNSGAKSDASRAAEVVRSALLESVEHHFVSDVPVGLFLSGGIDSTALLALAHLTGRKNLRTFSVGSDDAAFDESDVAARSAAHFETDHKVLRLDGATARGYFEEFLQHMDQPSVDGFNTYTVSRFACREGMKVVLSGLGGDELFGGYPSFLQVPRMLAMRRRAGWIGPIGSAGGALLSHLGTTPRWQRVGEFFSGRATVGRAYAGVRGIFTAREAAALAAAATDTEPGSRRQRNERSATFSTVADEISALELTTYMRNQLLRDSDVMSMANSLELRVPFVDSRLVDCVTQIPASDRVREGKATLLDAIPEVPSWVANAPKRGFSFPFERWIGSDWTAGTQLAHEAGVSPKMWYQRWAIFVFEHWLRTL